MAAEDPYLHAGLTPNTDVELYASAAAGGTTYNKTGQGVVLGVGAGTQDLTYSEAGTAVVVGVGSGAKSVAANRTGQGIAQGVASGAKSVERPRTGIGIAQGVGSGSQDLTYSETGQAVAVAVASGTKSIAGAKTGVGIAQGVASGTQNVTTVPAPPVGGTGGGSVIVHRQVEIPTHRSGHVLGLQHSAFAVVGHPHTVADPVHASAHASGRVGGHPHVAGSAAGTIPASVRGTATGHAHIAGCARGLVDARVRGRVAAGHTTVAGTIRARTLSVVVARGTAHTAPFPSMRQRLEEEDLLLVLID